MAWYNQADHIVEFAITAGLGLGLTGLMLSKFVGAIGGDGGLANVVMQALTASVTSNIPAAFDMAFISIVVFIAIGLYKYYKGSVGKGKRE